MGANNWEHDRMLNHMFSHVPPQQRKDFLERRQREKEQMNGGDKKKVTVAAPKKPFLKKTATGTSKKAGEPGQGDHKSPPKSDRSRPMEGIYEVMTAQLGMVTPRPMFVDRLPGTEFVDYDSYSATTSPGGEDNHTHEATYDEAGNGSTKPDDTGHTHSVRSFMVDDYQHPDGIQYHGHPGPLPRPERTPGSEYKPYDGIM